jgi:hypothetical protein
MGGGRWDSSTWADYSTRAYGSADRDTLRKSAAVSSSFSRKLDPDLDPSKLGGPLDMRESRDSDDNPNSTAIMLFTDVTGSMGHLAQEILSAMDIVCSQLYDRKPVTDPHILTGAIGDAYCDTTPLQVTQFEADIRIAAQTRKLYIEHGGGGNFGESYGMAWLFGAEKTAIDCFEKRGKKGFLFTVGDEPCLGAEGLKTLDGWCGTEFAVTREQAKEFLNLDLATEKKGLTAEEIYAMVTRQWEVIHICVNKNYEEGVMASFGSILGDRLLWLQDSKLLPELVVSSIQVIAGHDKDAVASSWGDADANKKIASAIKDLVPVQDNGADAGGVVAL